MRQLIHSILPTNIRQFLRWKINEGIRRFKQPRMLWGYRDSTGQWRDKTRISDTVFFYHPERIKIADNVFVWHYSILDGTGGLEIGEGSQIGAWVGLFTHSSHMAIRLYGNHYKEVSEDEKVGYRIGSVSIGRFVFIGAGAKVLPKVKIGDGALISAGAVVSKQVEPFEVVAGNPASVVGDTRKIDARYLRDEQIRSWYEEWQQLK